LIKEVLEIGTAGHISVSVLPLIVLTLRVEDHVRNDARHNTLIISEKKDAQ
jgi:hypothetical protein